MASSIGTTNQCCSGAGNTPVSHKENPGVSDEEWEKSLRDVEALLKGLKRCSLSEILGPDNKARLAEILKQGSAPTEFSGRVLRTLLELLELPSEPSHESFNKLLGLNELLDDLGAPLKKNCDSAFCDLGNLTELLQYKGGPIAKPHGLTTDPETGKPKVVSDDPTIRWNDVPCPERSRVCPSVHANWVSLRDGCRAIASELLDSEETMQPLLNRLSAEHTSTPFIFSFAKKSEPHSDVKTTSSEPKYEHSEIRRPVPGVSGTATAYDYLCDRTPVPKIVYTGWPKHRDTVPVAELTNLVAIFNKIIESNYLPIVQCEAGIGPSATLIAAYHIDQMINRGEITISHDADTTLSDCLEKINILILTLRAQQGPLLIENAQYELLVHYALRRLHPLFKEDSAVTNQVWSDASSTAASSTAASSTAASSTAASSTAASAATPTAAPPPTGSDDCHTRRCRRIAKEVSRLLLERPPYV